VRGKLKNRDKKKSHPQIEPNSLLKWK